MEKIIFLILVLWKTLQQFLAFKEDGNNISNIKYEDEDDFYCFSEKKTYTKDELFKKFNIKKVA